MSLKSKFFSVLTLAFGVAVFSASAFAQDTAPAVAAAAKMEKHQKGGRAGQRGFEGRGGKRGFGQFFRGIQLTEAQNAQMKAIRQTNKLSTATITELRTIREARKNGQPLTADQQARVKAFREQTKANRKSGYEQMLAVLTPEQRAQIETRKTEMRQRMENRRRDRKEKSVVPTVEKP